MVSEAVQRLSTLHVPTDEDDCKATIECHSRPSSGVASAECNSDIKPDSVDDDKSNVRPSNLSDTKLKISITESIDLNRQNPDNPAKKKGVAFKVSDQLQKPVRISGEAWRGGEAWTSEEYESGQRGTLRLSAYPGNPTTPTQKDRASTERLTVVVRQTIQHTSYYHGAGAQKFRQCLHGQVFLILMTVALFIALFLPEIWIIVGVNDNIFPNVVLTLVMVLFSFELFALSATDATYLLSFFFFMDILGTVSMIFDITYMLGVDNTEVLTYQSGDEDAKNNLMLLRAARAARVGARAGRLSRVIKFLRFLPFLSEKFGDESKGYAGQISKKLSNLLATRVACLTIILVVALPVIDILSFPQDDHAMQTWVERLSADLQENTAIGGMAFQAELAAMVPFFRKKNYGPYMACLGAKDGDGFRTDECFTTNWSYQAPNRPASALWVHTDTFMVGFNMHRPIQIDRTMAIVNIFFIIAIMIFSGLALSNVVTTLAVKPLERMVMMVRQIAETVFNFGKALDNEEDEHAGEEFDVTASPDMTLLEKVVNRLATMAQIHSGHVAERVAEEDIGMEGIGVLNLMEGRDLAKDEVKQQTRRLSKNACERGDKGRKMLASLIDLTPFGVSPDLLNSYAFNTLVLEREPLVGVGVHIVVQYHIDGDGFIKAEQDVKVLQRFVDEVEKNYHAHNAFHNFAHAIDVTQGVGKMMRLMMSEHFLSELEQFAMLIAAIGHDVGHPGVNNGYLLEVADDLALQYNDLSPLENMHVSKLYNILSIDGANVFYKLTPEQYRDVRHFCIDTILHTDMMGHTAMVDQLKMLYSKFEEVFIKGGSASTGAEVLNENKMLVMENILHSADISNPCRVWTVSHAWAMQVLEEFFSQGDLEKKHSIPVQMLNDRDTLNRPFSQIGFLEFMIAPLFVVNVKLFHKLHEYGDNLAFNVGKWEELWAENIDPVSGKTPDDAARAKAKARVEKVRATLEEAKQISAPLIAVISPN